MSSPNTTTLAADFSTSPLSPSAAASAAGRKRQIPNAPVYSPNETLNQMTQEVSFFLFFSYLK